MFILTRRAPVAALRLEVLEDRYAPASLKLGHAKHADHTPNGNAYGHAKHGDVVETPPATGTLCGTVFDANGSPNVGVNVFVDFNFNGDVDAGETTRTDETGHYVFNGVAVSPPGGYTVVADNQGATTSKSGVAVAAGSTTVADLQFPSDDDGGGVTPS